MMLSEGLFPGTDWTARDPRTAIGYTEDGVVWLLTCDGRKTLQIIRGLEGAENIPVVFLTAVADKDHIAAVLQLSPAGYLLKPADAERIYSIIEKVLG